MATVLSRAHPARVGGDGEEPAGGQGDTAGLARLGDAALAVVLCGVAGFAFVAVPLAVGGWFRPLFVVPGAALATAALVVLWDPLAPMPDRRAQPGLGWGWIAAAAIAVVSVLASFATVDQHVLQDRDPGHYVNAALWLAEDGSLVVPAEVGPFADDEAITGRVRGTDVRSDGSATFQSLHLLPMMAAAASWVGGDRALFRTGLALGALSLLALYGLASRLVRPAFAVAATAGLAANLAFVFFTRSLYSEVPLLLCLLGGLWALDVALTTGSARRGVVAGAVFGATLMTRIDAPLHLAGLLPVGAVLVVRARLTGDGGRSVRRPLVAAAVTAGIGFALGSVDAVARSRGYVTSHADELAVIAAVLAVSTAAAVGVVVWSRWRPPIPQHRRALLGGLVAVAVVIGAGALVVVRPAVQVDHQVSGDARQTRSLQAAEGEPVDGHRSYAEDSARWQVWYLGPVAGAAAVAGLALVAGRAAAGRASRVELLVLGAGSLPLVLYLVRPSIYPDHPWAMRRFLPLPTPFLLLVAVVAADRLWSWWRTAGQTRHATPMWTRPVAGGLAVVIALAVVVHPVRALIPVREFHSYAEHAGMVRQLCRTMGDDAAALVLPSVSVIDESLPQALRSMCGVPAAAGRRDAGGAALGAPHVAALARRWADDGRRLWVVSDDPNRLTGREVPVVFDQTRMSDRELQPTLTRIPDGYRVVSRRLVAGPAPVGAP